MRPFARPTSLLRPLVRFMREILAGLSGVEHITYKDKREKIIYGCRFVPFSGGIYVTCNPSRLRACDALSSGCVSSIHQVLQCVPHTHKGERSQEMKRTHIPSETGREKHFHVSRLKTCPSCVVFPHPVSPTTIMHCRLLRVSTSFFLTLYIGKDFLWISTCVLFVDEPAQHTFFIFDALLPSQVRTSPRNYE